MKHSVFWLIITLITPIVVRSQPPAQILWAKWGIIDQVTSLSLLPDHKNVVTTGYDGTCGLWPLGGSRPTWSHSFPPIGTIYCSALIGQTANILCGGGNSIFEWNSETNEFGSPLFTVSVGPVRYVACSPDGAFAAESGDDGHFRIIDLATGTVKLDLSGSGDGSGPVCFSSDGTQALGVINNIIQIVDIMTFKVVKTFPSLLDSYTGCAVAANPISATQFAISGLNGLMVFDISGKILASWPFFEGANSIDFTPDGRELAISENGLDLEILDIANDSSSSIGASSYCRFINNDTIISTKGFDVSLYSVSQRGLIKYLSSASGGGSMAFSSDGQMLAAAGDGIAIYDSRDGTALNYIQAATANVAASRDLTKFVGVGPNGEIYFWSSLHSNGVELRGSVSDTLPNFILEFSPDDSIFAVGTSLQEFDTSFQDKRNNIELHSSKDGALLHVLSGSLLPFIAMSFSKDGSKIESWSEMFCEWRTSDGVLIDSSWFQDTAISFNQNVFPDGNTQLAIVDSNAELYDLSSGTVTKTFSLGMMGFSSLAINPVNGNFATGMSDGSVIMWSSPLNSRVKETPSASTAPLMAYVTNSRITVDVPTGAESGKIFAYRSDGRCYFTAEVRAGESSATTSVLPMGDYFIVFETASGGKYFTKVSLFQ